MKEVLLPRDYEEKKPDLTDPKTPSWENLAGLTSEKQRIEPWGAIPDKVSKDWNASFATSLEKLDIEREIQTAMNKTVRTVAHTHTVSDISGLSAVVSLPSTAGAFVGQGLFVQADGLWGIDWVKLHP